MNRRIVLITSVSLGLLLSLTTLAILASDNRNKVTVSFLNSEHSNGVFPANVESERLAFAVRNAGSKPASFEVSKIEDEHGKWVPSRYLLGDVEAGKSAHLYLYLPRGSHPQKVRMRMLRKASVARKTQFALRLLIEKASGRYPGKPVWFDGLTVPVWEFTVKLDKAAEPPSSRQHRDRTSVGN